MIQRTSSIILINLFLLLCFTGLYSQSRFDKRIPLTDGYSLIITASSMDMGSPLVKVELRKGRDLLQTIEVEHASVNDELVKKVELDGKGNREYFITAYDISSTYGHQTNIVVWQDRKGWHLTKLSFIRGFVEDRDGNGVYEIIEYYNKTEVYSFQQGRLIKKSLNLMLRAFKNKPVHVELINSLSPIQLTVLRNSIYANYGYLFQKKWLRKHFKSQSWYKPHPNFKEAMLTQTDKENIHKILEIEKQKRKSEIDKLKSIKISKKECYLGLQVLKKFPKEDFLKKAELYSRDFYPEFLEISLFKPVSKSKLDNMIDETDRRERSFDYYIAEYDTRLRKLTTCYFESGPAGCPGCCNSTYYFDGQSKLRLVTGVISQTTLAFEWHLEYFNDELVTAAYHEWSEEVTDSRSTVEFYAE